MSTLIPVSATVLTKTALCICDVNLSSPTLILCVITSWWFNIPLYLLIGYSLHSHLDCCDFILLPSCLFFTLMVVSLLSAIFVNLVELLIISLLPLVYFCVP